MSSVRHTALAALLALAAAGGCGRTFKSSVTQPNPLAQPPVESLRESEVIVIVTGDMDLNLPASGGASGGAAWIDVRYPLTNAARFTVVSRDRLRFHVQIEHKWQEWADVSTWSAYLVDDRGRRYRPDDVDLISRRHITRMWDYEIRSVAVDGFGDIVEVRRDGHRRRAPLGSLSLFRGRGDFVFHQRDMFASSIRSLTLHIERSGTAFEFTWRFDGESGVASPSGGSSIQS